MTSLSIGEVARRAGMRTSAIRYYESMGILTEPCRHSGHRRNLPDVLASLTVIGMAQEAGFTIAEIGTLFNGFDPETPAAERWHVLAGQKITEIAARIERLTLMRHVLDQSRCCACLTLDACAALSWNTMSTPNQMPHNTGM